jgi:hypothetical protein
MASRATNSSKSLSRRTLSLQADLPAVHGASARRHAASGSAGDMGTAQPILIDIDFRRTLLYVSSSIRWSANKRTISHATRVSSRHDNFHSRAVEEDECKKISQ